MKFDIQLNGAIDCRYPYHTGTNFIKIDTWTFSPYISLSLILGFLQLFWRISQLWYCFLNIHIFTEPGITLTITLLSIVPNLNLDQLGDQHNVTASISLTNNTRIGVTFFVSGWTKNVIIAIKMTKPPNNILNSMKIKIYVNLHDLCINICKVKSL